MVQFGLFNFENIWSIFLCVP